MGEGRGRGRYIEHVNRPRSVWDEQMTINRRWEFASGHLSKPVQTLPLWGILRHYWLLEDIQELRVLSGSSSWLQTGMGTQGEFCSYSLLVNRPVRIALGSWDNCNLVTRHQQDRKEGSEKSIDWHTEMFMKYCSYPRLQNTVPSEKLVIGY